LAVED
jgi:hypothetical protein